MTNCCLSIGFHKTDRWRIPSCKRWSLKGWFGVCVSCMGNVNRDVCKFGVTWRTEESAPSLPFYSSFFSHIFFHIHQFMCRRTHPQHVFFLTQNRACFFLCYALTKKSYLVLQWCEELMCFNYIFLLFFLSTIDHALASIVSFATLIVSSAIVSSSHGSINYFPWFTCMRIKQTRVITNALLKGVRKKSLIFLICSFFKTIYQLQKAGFY